VSINLHWPLLIIELDTPLFFFEEIDMLLFNGHLYLLIEPPAFIGMVQRGIVALAPLLPLELFG
jgi:hypothetical protein